MHHLVYFFCFRHLHTYTIFERRYYVVVILALRVPSNSVSLLHSFSSVSTYKFPYMLTKIFVQFISRIKSRVFLHYLINTKIKSDKMPPQINCSPKEYLGSAVATIPPIFCPIAPPITIAELILAIFFAFSSFSDN